MAGAATPGVLDSEPSELFPAANVIGEELFELGPGSGPDIPKEGWKEDPRCRSPTGKYQLVRTVRLITYRVETNSVQLLKPLQQYPCVRALIATLLHATTMADSHGVAPAGIDAESLRVEPLGSLWTRSHTSDHS